MERAILPLVLSVFFFPRLILDDASLNAVSLVVALIWLVIVLDFPGALRSVANVLSKQASANDARIFFSRYPPTITADLGRMEIIISILTIALLIKLFT